MDLTGKVRALETLLAPPAGSPPLELVETHFAYVLLTDEFAYKLKKPVNVPPLILDTLEARYRSCCDELRLNRRLAADVYLEVVALRRRADGVLSLGGEGEPIEWLVKMRRLPWSLMLDRAMQEWTVSQAAIARVGARLAEFYREQAPVVFSAQEYVARLTRQIESNRNELLAPDLQMVAQDVQQLGDLQQAAVQELKAELGARAERGRVVEGHGDLRPEHICLSTPPRIIDCLEFSCELRVLDPCEEIAYLSVECERGGHAWIGRTILGVYRRALLDPISPQLFQLYRSHRAATRAKIVAWHVRDPEYRSREPWPEHAREYLKLARASALRT